MKGSHGWGDRTGGKRGTMDSIQPNAERATVMHSDLQGQLHYRFVSSAGLRQLMV